VSRLNENCNQNLLLLCLSTNCLSKIQGIRIGVIVQMKNYYTPYLINVHCMIYCTNLEVQNLSSLTMVDKTIWIGLINNVWVF